MAGAALGQLTIRRPRDNERGAIDDLVGKAFDGHDEAALINRLVADGDVVLELVADCDGQVCGHILFSRLWIEEAASRFAALALAPLAVAPDLQRCGIGSKLIEAAHQQLREHGESLSIVLGDPAYYSRFNYQASRAAGFKSDYPAQYLQALALSEASDKILSGTLIYASAFGET